MQGDDGVIYPIGDSGQRKEKKKRAFYKQLSKQYYLPTITSHACTLGALKKILQCPGYGAVELPLPTYDIEVGDYQLESMHSLCCYFFYMETGKTLFHNDLYANKQYYIDLLGFFNPTIFKNISNVEYEEMDAITSVPQNTQYCGRRIDRFKLQKTPPPHGSVKRKPIDNSTEILQKLGLNISRMQKKKKYSSSFAQKAAKTLIRYSNKIIKLKEDIEQTGVVGKQLLESSELFALEIISSIKDDKVKQKFVDLDLYSKNKATAIKNIRDVELFHKIPELNLNKMSKMYQEDVYLKSFAPHVLRDPEMSQNFKQTILQIDKMAESLDKYKYMLLCFKEMQDKTKMSPFSSARGNFDVLQAIKSLMQLLREKIEDKTFRKILKFHQMSNVVYFSPISLQGIANVAKLIIKVGVEYVMNITKRDIRQISGILKFDAGLFWANFSVGFGQSAQKQFNDSAARFNAIACAVYNLTWARGMLCILQSTSIESLNPSLLEMFYDCLPDFENEDLQHEPVSNFLVSYLRHMNIFDSSYMETIEKKIDRRYLPIFIDIMRNQKQTNIENIKWRIQQNEKDHWVFKNYEDLGPKVAFIISIHPFRDSIRNYFLDKNDIKKQVFEMLIVSQTYSIFMERFCSGLSKIIAECLADYLSTTKCDDHFIGSISDIYVSLLVVISENMSDQSMYALVQLLIQLNRPLAENEPRNEKNYFYNLFLYHQRLDIVLLNHCILENSFSQMQELYLKWQPVVSANADKIREACEKQNGVCIRGQTFLKNLLGDPFKE